MSKIALIGSAPSSVKKAPYEDPSWTFFGCSPGAIVHMRKIDAFFELHRWREGVPATEPQYVARLAKLAVPVYMVHPVPEIPGSVKLPKEEILRYVYAKVADRDGTVRDATFNPNDFGSSISWMMAFAIMQRPEEIGLWGVDMAANEEWEYQRSGLQSLIHIAKSIGIRVTLPLESDLIRPNPLYGYQEHDHLYIKLETKLEEIRARKAEVAARVQSGQQELVFLNGAEDILRYTIKTWVSDPQAVAVALAQPEPKPVIKTPEEAAEIGTPIQPEPAPVQPAAKPYHKRGPKPKHRPNGEANAAA
jgi:hypothetical protein